MAPRADADKQARRLETEARLVSAVGDVLRERGFPGLGINAIAKSAGVPKTLIYRYFGGIEELVRAFGKSGQFWPTVDDVLGPDREVLELEDPSRVGREVLERYAAVLRSRPTTLELLAWECSERPPLMAILEDTRQEFSTHLVAELSQSGLDFDPRIRAAADIVAGAINYFAVRGRHIRWFASLDIGTDEGWSALFDSVEVLFRALSPS